MNIYFLLVLLVKMVVLLSKEIKLETLGHFYNFIRAKNNVSIFSLYIDISRNRSNKRKHQ